MVASCCLVIATFSALSDLKFWQRKGADLNSKATLTKKKKKGLYQEKMHLQDSVSLIVTTSSSFVCLEAVAVASNRVDNETSDLSPNSLG